MRKPALYGLVLGISLSMLGVIVGGPSGTLLLAFSGNLLSITGVYIAAGKRRNGNGTS